MMLLALGLALFAGPALYLPRFTPRQLLPALCCAVTGVVILIVNLLTQPT